MLLNINLHKAFLSSLLNLREETIFFAAVVVCDHLVPAQAIADEILIVFRLDMGSLEIDTGFCQSVNYIDMRDWAVGGEYLLSARIMVLCAIAI